MFKLVITTTNYCNLLPGSILPHPRDKLSNKPNSNPMEHLWEIVNKKIRERAQKRLT